MGIHSDSQMQILSCLDDLLRAKDAELLSSAFAATCAFILHILEFIFHVYILIFSCSQSPGSSMLAAPIGSAGVA